MEIEQKELYICDHAEECPDNHCAVSKKHKCRHSAVVHFCETIGAVVKCIPYKEKEEPEKSCETCGNRTEHGECTSDIGCDLGGFGGWAPKIEHDKAQCIPYKEKEEVHENQDVDIAFSIHYPCCWDTMVYPTLASALWEIASPAGMTCSGCGQALYSPAKPETVKDVLKRMPKTEDYISAVGYWCDMENFEKDLKAAQEREEV